MNTVHWLLVAAALGSVAPLAAANHNWANCVPTRADPSTVNVIDTPNGQRFYLEERGNPLGTHPPVPGSGFLLGDGTWMYEEANGIDAPEGSMQRGGGGWGSCFPPPPLPCLLIDEDPIYDETCGRGPDAIIF